MDPKVDAYITRSHRWPDEMRAMRSILLKCGMTEQIKWGKPCYDHEGRNIVIVQEMKDFLALMFFKGALLKDPDGVLEDQGPNSRSARRMTVRSVDDVDRLASTIATYIDEAIAVEDAGLVVDAAPDLVLVDELREGLDRDPALDAAFGALTPGRRREYNLFISGAKLAATRAARVEKCASQILAGKGLRDR